MKLEFSRQSFAKSSYIKFNENPSCGSRVVPYGRTDGQTDRHDEEEYIYIYLHLDTTNFKIVSNYKANLSVATCFGRSCIFRPALKTQQVPWCAHKMGSHMFTCVCTCKVKEHQLKSVFKAGLKMAA
jgi:hypothetical protein